MNQRSIRLFGTDKQLAVYINCTEISAYPSGTIEFTGDLLSFVATEEILGTIEYKTIGRFRVRTSLAYVEELKIPVEEKQL